MKTSLIAFAIFTTVACPSVWAQETITNHTVKKSNALTDPVQHHKGRGVWAEGEILGRPTRGKPNSGTIIGTDEMHIIVGNFQDDTKYSGNTLNVSTKQHDVFTAIDQLDQEKDYVFSYWESYPFHFNMEDSDTKITGYSPAKNPSSFMDSGLPYEYDVANGKVGHHTGVATTKGRIIEVARKDTYFFGRAICMFVLDQGGSRRGQSVANEQAFEVFSEEGCRYVETLLPYGLELKVTYTVAKATIDPSDHFAQNISVDRIPGLSIKTSKDIISGNALTQQVLDDPNFQAGVAKLIDQYWAEHHAPNSPR